MSWQKALEQLGELNHNELMARHTTLAVGGAATWYFKPSNKTALAKALPLIPANIRILALGRGSNLLISNDGFYGIVIDLGMLNSILIEDHLLTAQAGCRMSKVAQTAANAGLSGLEFMATVPGDLGGGIAMNAGAFKQQTSDSCIQADVMHRDGTISTLAKDQLNMSYRHSDIPQQAIIVSASFALKQSESDSVRERMREMRQQRSQTQPLSMPNCGSVFKNPEGDYAARLIEAAGLKGKRIGDAQISEVHANFIVNHGHAHSDDITSLMQLAQQRVFKEFAIKLEPEVRILDDLQ